MNDRGSEKLERLSLKQLREHPRNPRLILNEGTIAALESAFRQRKAFAKKYAILVRPIDENLYEIISGHQRVAAARRAGLREVWAFVEVMNDEQAFRELGLANTQNELHPLELAMHSLGVTLAQGKKGGGLDAWARQLGVHPVLLRRHQKGARVFETVRATLNMSDVTKCLTRVEQLSAIGHPDVDQSRWSSLVRTCIDEDWTIETARVRARESSLRAPPARASPPAPPTRASATDRVPTSGDLSASTPAADCQAPPRPTSHIDPTEAPESLATPIHEDGLRSLSISLADNAGRPIGGEPRTPRDSVHARIVTRVRVPEFHVVMGEEAGPVDESMLVRARAYHDASQAVFAVLQRRPIPKLALGAEPFPVPDPLLEDDPDDPDFDADAVREGWRMDLWSKRAEVERDALFWMSGTRGAVRLMTVEGAPYSLEMDNDDGIYVTQLLDRFEGSRDTSAHYTALIAAQADDLLQRYWGAVEAIARALLDVGVVAAADVQRMVGECTPAAPQPRQHPRPPPRR